MSRDLSNGQSVVEDAADGLMTQVMEVETG